MKLYGKPIDTAVASQLEYRRNNLVKSSKNIANLSLDNNRGAFVTLCSGATQIFYEKDQTKIPNIQKYPDIKQNQDGIFLSNVLAQSNVLHGGTLYRRQLSESDANDYDGILRGGINFASNYSELGSTSAYEFSELYGYRPMMGITNLSINYKSSYGAIREGVITISANSAEQLTILDKLYFRPGYCMLLEWGNVIYLDDVGEISTMQKSFRKDFLQFDANLMKIRRAIQDQRDKTGFNYDGMIGRVTNFDWKYRSDGGYDCTVKIISEGDVIEGISTTFTTPNNYWTRDITDTGQADTNNTYDDKLTDIFESFKVSNNNWSKLRTKLKEDGIDDIPLYKTTFDKEGEGSKRRQNSFIHTSLEVVLKLLNRYLLEENAPASIDVKFNTDPDSSKMITFVGHVSNDPSVCIMPYRSGTAGGFNNTPTEFETYLVKKKKSLLYGIRQSENDLKNIPNSPMKILVNIDHLIKIQSSLISEEGEDVDNDSKLSRFMNTLLSDLSNALGSINKFKLLFDKDNNIYNVVDDNLIEGENEIDDGLPTIDVSGLGSFATNVSIESKISPQMTNMLAIAASTTGTDLDTSIEGILKYNRGITDRFSINKEGSAGKTKEQKETTHPVKTAFEDSRKNALKAIGLAYLRIRQGVYSESLFESTVIPHRKYTKALYEYLQLRQRDEGRKIPYSGLIPIELTLELRGITGFKVGEAFKINPEILPERYRDKIGFVVTGIDHKIGTDNFWTTGIKTNMYMLPSDEVESLGSDFNELSKVDIKALIEEALSEAEPGTGGYTPSNQPWSAAFISYIARKGDSSFPTSQSHTGYAQKVRTQATDRWEVLNGEVVSPRVGDIVIQNRSGNDLKFSDSKYSGKSHGDLIVDVTTTKFTVIGGNLSHTVQKKEISYTKTVSSGKESGRPPYIIVLRPKDGGGVNVVNMVNEAEREWNVWRTAPPGVNTSLGGNVKYTTPLSEANKNDKERRANKTDTRGNELFNKLKEYWAVTGVTDFNRDV